MKIGSRLIHFPIYQPKFITTLRPLINLGPGSLPAKAPVDTDNFFALAGPAPWCSIKPWVVFLPAS